MDDAELFIDDEPTRSPAEEAADRDARPPWVIMIVDDDAEVHAVTRLALRRFTLHGRTLEFLSAYSAAEAIRLIASHPEIAVILLDVVMETEQAGLDVVRYIRNDLENAMVRIILRTGQPGDAPEDAVLVEYDINDYKTKTELTRQKLHNSILVSLRTYEHISTIHHQRRELMTRAGELNEARLAAEASDRAKTEFLATMSHEFRTPLSIALLKAELTETGRYGPVTEEQMRAMRIIQQSGGKLLDMINEVLALAQLETNDVQASIRPVLVESLCEVCYHRATVAAEAKDQGLRLDVDPTIRTVMADEIKLAQVLQRLLQNAVKFTPRGGEIGLEVTHGAQVGTVAFTVWDTGIGIAQQDIERAFQPFIQLDTGLARAHEGAGLGLAVASRLIKAMDGKITVESERDQGSRFTVTVAAGD